MRGEVTAGLASEEGPAGEAAALPEDPVPSSASWSCATVRVRGIGDALTGDWRCPVAAGETEGGVLPGACLVSGDEGCVGPEVKLVPAPGGGPFAAPEVAPAVPEEAPVGLDAGPVRAPDEEPPAAPEEAPAGPEAESVPAPDDEPADGSRPSWW
jgi:hypothetical protein